MNGHFEEIQQLFTISSCLRHLNFKLEAHEKRKIIFQPSTWQTLIEENLPGSNLLTTPIELYHCTSRYEKLRF